MHRLIALGLLVAAAPVSAQSGYRDGYAGASDRESVKYAYADVLRVDPIYETVRYREPREECREQQVERVERSGDPTGSAIVGAIVGGVIGSNVGSGSGRRAATAAGAVIGGAVGHDIGKQNSRERRYVGTEQRCQIVDVEREERRIAGYDVEYQFKGDVFMSRLPYDPGNKLRVRVAVSPAD